MAQENVSYKCSQTRIRPRVLSPFVDPTAPENLEFLGAERFWGLFECRNYERSPRPFLKNDPAHACFGDAAEAKLRSDTDMGYDISIVPYPLGFDPKGWGILSDRVGRLFAVTQTRGDTVQLQYQNGRCRSFRDWHEVVECQNSEEQDRIRCFYNSMRLRADRKIAIAGTVGFGLWDAFWMTFDFDAAREMLSAQPDFADMVFRYWKSFHVGAVSAMLDAGIKLIFMREDPKGFSRSRGLSRRLDPFLRSHFSEVSYVVHSRGGSLFFDCDADEMIETDYPAQWGFDGIGPLLFRDADDLIAARRSLNEDLVLIGATLFPIFPGFLAEKDSLAQNLVLALPNNLATPLDRGETCPSDSGFSKKLRKRFLPSWMRTGAWHL